MTAEVRLEGMEFFAKHGFYSEEQKLGNRYSISVGLYADIEQAAQQDLLHATVDYEQVYQIVAKHVQQPARLLEHLAYRIAKSILEAFLQVQTVEVEVSKHNPPLGGLCAKASVRLRLVR